MVKIAKEDTVLSQVAHQQSKKYCLWLEVALLNA
jgi:hypothetical protein